MAEGSLAGRRIVVTRPREQAQPLVEGREESGATVSLVPLVEIRPVDDTGELDAAVESLARDDWIVFTSANGVAAVGTRLRSLDGVRIAAVGPATAAAVRALGPEPSFVPKRFAAEEIAPGLGALAGVRVLLPQADIADPKLADELRARGATVAGVVVYRTVEIAPDLSGMLALEAADAVVLASPSAARRLAALELGRCPLTACIGPTTGAAAREAGLPVGLVARKATAEGMIHALVSHFEESR